MYIKPLFSNGTASNKLEQQNTCMKLNCSINLHLGFYKMSFRTDSVDQDQTAQTEQCDVGFTLSVNLWDMFFVKNITLK